MDINQFLKKAHELNASDLHLSSGHKPTIRIDGDLQPLEDTPVLENETLTKMLQTLLSDKQKAALEKQYELDFSFSLLDLCRVRVNIFHQSLGISAAFRLIPAQVTSIENLALPEMVKGLCHLPRGLVLVTGPTGSGKSTTLAAMIDYINASKPSHILTIEDPIEYIHKSKKSLIQQREVGEHTNSFNDALKFALREDPDIILIGEMRDLTTVRLALTAAETGHLVFATLHTNSAPKTINRIIDVFPAGEKSLVRSMLSESLQAVIAQVLVKRIGGGRIAAHEIMVSTPAIRNMIREDKIPQIVSAIQTGQAVGMQTLEKSLDHLVQQHLIEPSIKEGCIST